MKTARKRILRILEEICLCQPNDRVFICFELTDSMVILATLSLRKSLSPQDFCRIAVNFKCLSSLCMSSRIEHFVSNWTNLYEILNFLTFGKCGSKVQVSLKSDKMAGALLEDLCT